MPESSLAGNLRELSNFVKRYLVLGDPTLAVAELQPKPDGGGGLHTDPAGRAAAAGAESPGGLKSLARNAKDEAEAEAIARALEETNWNRKQAAALLKISYKALLYKIRQYGIAQSRSTSPSPLRRRVSQVSGLRKKSRRAIATERAGTSVSQFRIADRPSNPTVRPEIAFSET